MRTRRRPLIVFAIIAAALAATVSALAKPTHFNATAACPGSERWDVKTLVDPAVRQVNLNHVVSTTVAELRTTKPNVSIGAHTPRLPSERTVYRVSAHLVEAKIEADGDIHLVIATPGSSSGQMIAEFPKPACPPEDASPDVNAIDKARSDFVGICGTPGSSAFMKLNGDATITGVGFFDVKHGGKGQTGHAPYNRELHPVVGFSASSC